MITTAFLNLGFAIVSALVGSLPNSAGFGPTITQAATTIGGYFGMFAPVIPMGTLASAVAMVFTVEIGIFTWKTGKSLISHLPWIGGAGH